MDISKADMLCALLQSILSEPGAIERTVELSKVKTFVTQAFVFAYLWAVGGNAIDSSRDTFELYVRDQFDTNPDAR